MYENVSLETQKFEAIRFKGRLLPALPSRYIEPSLSNPLIVPHGAIPANPFLNSSVKQQQLLINSQFSILYETPPVDMPEEFVDDVVIADYVINGERRKMENFESFMKFVHSDSPIDESLLSEIELFEPGRANMKQIAHIATHTGIHAVEFGEVTHPYGYRMQYLDRMREEANAAIEAQGGVVYPTVTPYRSIKILPKVRRYQDGSEFGAQRIVGFIVKYKRDYGYIPTAGKDNEVLRVVERQIAAYRVDPASGFDQNVLQSMHDFRNKYPKRIHWDVLPPDDDENAKQIFYTRLKITGCANFIENAVQADALDDFVVPISTTIYGYKEKLPQRPVMDHVAHKALELSLNHSFDLLPGAQKPRADF